MYVCVCAYLCILNALTCNSSIVANPKANTIQTDGHPSNPPFSEAVFLDRSDHAAPWDLGRTPPSQNANR